MKLWSMSAAVVTLVLVAVAPEANGGGGTPITVCGQMVAANAVLTQDLVCPGDGIVVGASGITIDLKGFTIRGDRDVGDYGIDDSAGYDNITIKNGLVRNFYLGVDAEGAADGVSVSSLVATGNGSYGILIDGDSGKVQSSTASGNFTAGIFVGGDFAQVKSSTMAGNGSYGMIIGGDFAQIRSSTAAGSSTIGIEVIGDSAQVTSSVATGNGVDGIYVSGDAWSIKGNDTDGNGFAGGASDLAGLGIHALNYTTAPAGKNVARGNDDPAECGPALLC
jgi:large repetitive protein